MSRMASLRSLANFLPRRRPRSGGPRVLIATDEHGGVTIVPAPESREFWRQCPWAGDDEESVRFRQVMDEQYG